MKQIAEFIRDLDIKIPWLVSRFYPNYQLIDLPPTPVETLRKTREIGLELGLKYVYQGNVQEGENTYCHSCGELLIMRLGYEILENRIANSRCPNCYVEIDGVWE